MLFLSLLFLISPAAAKKKAEAASNSANSAASSDDPSAPEYQVGTKLGEAPHSTEAKYNVNKIGERGIGSGLNFYSLDKEIGLGRQLATQVETHAKIIKDPIVSEYVNRLGQTLVRNSDARVPFTIKVIDNDEINAFALPGGFFYVNSGLIMAADNEAELAGVMAHEIAHVAARHATKQMTRSQLFNMAQLPLIFVGGPVAYTLEQAAGLGMPVSFLKFSRDSEREADLLGLEYEYSSGYDPAAFVQFFEKIAKEQKQKVSFLAKAFATHPMTGDRIRLAQREIQDLLPARPEYVVDTSEFQDMKAHLATLMSTQRMHGPHGRPVLHKRERATLKTGAGGSTGSSDSSDAQTTAKHQDDDQRPTLKRDPS
ncbi:MAG: M48 family metallopeptidase [Candidatus Korobacteraceae bacterium]